MESLDSGTLSILIAVFGLLIGSFLNVVIYRLPRRQSLFHPRSACPNCSRPIRWYENIPVLSYLFLRAKCAGCSAKISFRYPLVELLTAVLFLAAYLKFGWGWYLVYRDFPFICLLISICFIDLDHRIIPDRLSLSGLILGLVTAFFVPDVRFLGAFFGAVVGFLAFYIPAFLYERLTGRMGLGGGDIKFLAMLGAFVGVSGVFTTIFVSSILGSIVGITLGIIQRRGKGASDRPELLKVSIPYGPFLVVGGLYSYLLADVIWSPFMNLM